MKIFNLEFPPRCVEINVSGYKFVRVDDYGEQLNKLQHLGERFSEFHIHPNTGQHAVTANVIIPETPADAILKWRHRSSALDDILLLLSIFTSRDVFALEDDELKKDGLVFLADSRTYSWGGILRCSIPYLGQPNEDELSELEISPLEFNIGFEEGINQIYDRLRSRNWQEKYHNGDFLFLSRTAFRRQPINSTFIQCWAIWEHLFAVINPRGLSEKRIVSLDATQKISSILVEFGLIDEIDPAIKEQIERLKSMRNRLIHFGAFPEPNTYFKNSPRHTSKIQKFETILSDAELFIRLTEYILAKILGLSPSNVFNTEEKFEKFLNRNKKR